MASRVKEDEFGMETRTQLEERQAQLKIEHEQYLAEHPEIRTLLGDFMLHVLSRRPTDLIAEANQYFATFSGLPSQQKVDAATAAATGAPLPPQLSRSSSSSSSALAGTVELSSRPARP